MTRYTYGQDGFGNAIVFDAEAPPYRKVRIAFLPMPLSPWPLPPGVVAGYNGSDVYIRSVPDDHPSGFTNAKLGINSTVRFGPGEQALFGENEAAALVAAGRAAYA